MRKENVRVLMIALIILIGLGYAALRTGLNINGTANVTASSWSVYFDNYQNSQNTNITPTTEPTITGTTTTSISYVVNLVEPGDMYEFTVDVVNGGSIDANISVLSKLGGNEIGQGNPVPDYIDYVITDDNNTALVDGHRLNGGDSEVIKVKVLYKTDIDPEDLPGDDAQLLFDLELEATQAEKLPPAVEDANFATDSWDNIIAASKSANPTQLQADMASGTTRAVPLDLNLDGTSDATCNLRIANLSTPAECSTAGFSQTACGLVLECANVVTTHVMNSTTTNVGGWPASAMRTYLNDETANAVSIYNALPSELSSKIIPTYVVSGHGPTSGEVNFTSTDKLYLLSTKEVGFDANYDSAKAETRILDFYNLYNNNQTRVKKNLSNSATNWWLRSADSSNTRYFYNVLSSGSISRSNAIGTNGVSPAFRIG